MIDATYRQIGWYAEVVSEFTSRYGEYMATARDYGNGELMKSVEIHTLTMIEDRPGITISELAKLWKRTKGTVSVNVAALEAKGYVERRKEPGNDKVVHLYATEAGVDLSTMHKAYDNLHIMQTQNELLKSCSREELDAFYKVLQLYIQRMEEVNGTKGP